MGKRRCYLNQFMMEVPRAHFNRRDEEVLWRNDLLTEDMDKELRNNEYLPNSALRRLAFRKMSGARWYPSDGITPNDCTEISKYDN
jgi:hypothetical protein